MIRAGGARWPRRCVLHDLVIVPRHAGRMRLRRAFAAAVAAGACATAACSGPGSVPASAARQLTTLPHGTAAPHGTASPHGAASPYGAGATSAGPASAGVTGRPGGPATAVRAAAAVPGRPLPPPAALTPFVQAPFVQAPFAAPAAAGQGRWSPAGRAVSRNGHSVRVVYQTTLIPPGGTQAAGIAWMDTRLLSARLYSGSVSPGRRPVPVHRADPAGRRRARWWPRSTAASR